LKATSKVCIFRPVLSLHSSLILPDFIIPDAEFEALNSLDRNQRYNYPFRWGVDVFGELGSEEAERRAEEDAAKKREAA
jgi:L-glyceraldehyde reductase